MTTTRPLILGLVTATIAGAAVLCGFTIFLSRGSTSFMSSVGLPARPCTDRPRPAPIPDSQNPIPDSESRQTAATPTRSIVGVADIGFDLLVWGSHGQRLERAYVSVEPLVSANCIATQSALSGYTNEEGRLRLQVPTQCAYLVTVSRPGFAKQRIATLPGPLTVNLEEAGSLAIRASDAMTGQPVAGVRLSFEDSQGNQNWTCVTGAAGDATAMDVPPGRYSMIVMAEHYMTYTIHDVLAPEQGIQRDINVLMYSGRSIRGIAVDKDSDRPITHGVIEEVSSSANLKRAEIQADGSFTLRGIHATVPYVRVVAEGYDSSTQPLAGDLELRSFAPDAVDGVVVKVSRLRSVTGKVLANGLPVSNAKIAVALHGILSQRKATVLPSNRKATAVSAADGTFTVDLPLSNLEPRLPWDVLVLAEGYAPLLRRPELFPGTQLILELTLGAAIELHVSDGAAPEVGAAISLQLRNPGIPSDKGSVLELLGPQARTNSVGAATIRNVPSGQWELDVVSLDGARAHHSVMRTDGVNECMLEVVLSPDTVLSGVIVDADDQPIARARVAWSGDEASVETYTSENGAFSLYLHSPGAVQISVGGSEIEGTAQFVVKPGTPQRLVVTRRKSGCRALFIVMEAQTRQPIGLAQCRVTVPARAGHGPQEFVHTVIAGQIALEIASPATVVFQADGFTPTSIDFDATSSAPIPVLLFRSNARQ